MAEEVILLIHGTFADDPKNEGSKWWQVRSTFWKYLERRFPEHPRLQTVDEVFHWCGDNTERSRRLGAKALLQFLQQRFESKGIRYHLICHSHGGSVLWTALKMSLQENYLQKLLKPKWSPLRNLRSWTTVGTPFLHYQVKADLSSTTKLCGYAFISLGALVLATIFFAIGVSMIAPTVVETIGLAERSALLIAALFLVLIPVGLGISLLIPFLEAKAVQRELILDKKAVDLYHNRWLGIWSEEDEAIAGLDIAGNISLSLIPEYSSGVGVYSSDRWRWLAKPTRSLVSWTFNRFIRSRLDKLVSRQIKRYMQGNDRPGIDITKVGPFPSLRLQGVQPLPEDICTDLKQSADAAAQDKIPQMRSLLGQAAASGAPYPILINQDWIFSGNELIHTSYFQNPKVREIIALHIARMAGLEHLKGRFKKAHLNWVDSFRKAAGDIYVKSEAATSARRRWYSAVD